MEISFDAGEGLTEAVLEPLLVEALADRGEDCARHRIERVDQSTVAVQEHGSVRIVRDVNRRRQAVGRHAVTLGRHFGGASAASDLFESCRRAPGMAGWTPA
jgi:hypothetical protein